MMSTPLSSPTSSRSHTSPTLLQRVADRDPAAWQQLVRLYGPLVHHWAMHKGLSEHDAADILQDVFVSVSRSIDRFERQRDGSFRRWLWTITRNRIVTWFRRQAELERAAGGTQAAARLAAIAEQSGDDPDEFTAHEVLSELHQQGLELVRNEFEPRTWQMFWAVTVEEHAATAVATEFGVSPATVRQAKSRILRRLRDVLGE